MASQGSGVKRTPLKRTGRIRPKVDPAAMTEFREGQRFGRWTVLRWDETKPRGGGLAHYWVCRCECGTVRSVRASQLRTGRSASCGCAGQEKNVQRLTKHGMYGTPTYQCWQAMIRRTCNAGSHEWSRYGGRGITVHPDWRDFEAFLRDMGERPSPAFSLDRINNEGNYEPGNVRWATAREQQHNTRAFKLDDASIREILARHRPGRGGNTGTLAAEFGIARTTVIGLSARMREDPLRIARDQVISRSRGRCEVCGDIGSEFSHRQARGMGGAAPSSHVASNGIWACRRCHARIEAEPAWAYSLGLKVRRGYKPIDVPVQLALAWWQLDDDGGKTQVSAGFSLPLGHTVTHSVEHVQDWEGEP